MAQDNLVIPFKLRFSGGDADSHQVASYLGTKAVHGFTRSIQIVTQAYLNKEPMSRATALHDANLFLTAVKQGSLSFEFKMEFLRKKPDVTLNSPTFFDFCSTIFHRATGRPYSPETSYVKKIEADVENDLIDLTIEQAEEALKEAHSAIGESIHSMTFERQRAGIQTYFDQETKSYIQSSIHADFPSIWKAHITRYNSITGNGRAFIESLNRVVPFSLQSTFGENKRGLLTWSLHGSNTHRSKNLNVDATEITSAAGIVKRLSVHDCTRVGDD